MSYDWSLVHLAKTGSAEELAGADAELEEMMEWLVAKLAFGDIERDQFQRVERIIAQLRDTIEKRLIVLPALPGKIVSIT